MTNKLVSRDTRRLTQTPNATMGTLASPSLSASTQLSMWTVDMDAGQRGPLHSFDSEQIWTLLEGGISIEVDGEQLHLGPGDTLTLHAGSERQITAEAASHMIVCGCAGAVASVAGETDARGTPAWIA